MENQYPPSDELTLKELILAVQDYFRYFLRKWYWFLVGAILMGGVLYWNAYSEPVTYAASLTFMLNESKDSPSGAGAILGGLGLGGSSSGGGVAPKLLELSKSRKVLTRVLFDSATVDGKTQLIADHLLEVYDYDERWEDNEVMFGFRFNEKKPLPDDQRGNRVLKSLIGMLTSPESGLLNIEYNEMAGIFDARVNSIHPDLSIHIVNGVYEELLKYFIDASTASKQQTVLQLRTRADSVQRELVVVEAQLARFQDRSSNITLRQSSVRGRELEREVYILSTMYGEIVKNRETAAFLLASEKPTFNLIDSPLEPLQAERAKTMSALITGLVLGGVLVGIAAFFTKLIKDAMR